MFRKDRIVLNFSKKTEKLSAFEILKGMDFAYSDGFDYEPNRETASDHYERCANDFCRCSTLSPEITSFDYKGIAKQIIEKFDIVEDRTSNRIENICKDLTKDDFYCDVVGGYYGEELESIILDNSRILKKLEEVIDIQKTRKTKLELLNKESNITYIDSEIIKDILIKEYGYLLDDLKDAYFSVIEVDTSDIVLPNREYAEKVRNSDLSGYKNHRGICGVVRFDGSKYKVIDGYHRVTVNMKKDKIKVILYA